MPERSAPPSRQAPTQWPYQSRYRLHPHHLTTVYYHVLNLPSLLASCPDVCWSASIMEPSPSAVAPLSPLRMVAVVVVCWQGEDRIVQTSVRAVHASSQQACGLRCIGSNADGRAAVTQAHTHLQSSKIARLKNDPHGAQTILQTRL